MSSGVEGLEQGSFNWKKTICVCYLALCILLSMMAVQWRRVCMILGIVGLCFFGIPIKIDKDNEPQKEELFKEFLQRFNKTYVGNETEYMTRYNNFKESLKVIDELNQGRLTNDSARYGVTAYSDLSKEEFLHLYLQPRLPDHSHFKKQKQSYHSYKYSKSIDKRALVDDLPMHVDWREKKVITDVRNQKTCGACWAFSTAETIETMYAIRTGTLHKLSVQELIDCAGNGNLGCEGGDTCSLLEWLVDKKINVELDSEYPLSWKTQMCKLKGSEQGIQIASNFTCEYLAGSEDVILMLLAYHGPVAIAVNAVNWQNYLGGVIQFHCDGDPLHINHAVQIVGYDRSPPVPHYIIRNSWGVEFGDNGYLYIAIGKNLCGLATEICTLDVLEEREMT